MERFVFLAHPVVEQRHQSVAEVADQAVEDEELGVELCGLLRRVDQGHGGEGLELGEVLDQRPDRVLVFDEAKGDVDDAEKGGQSDDVLDHVGQRDGFFCTNELNS